MIDNKLLIRKIASLHSEIKTNLESIRDNTAHARLYASGQDKHFEAIKTAYRHLAEVAGCSTNVDKYIAALRYDVRADRGLDVDMPYNEIQQHQRVLNDVTNWFNELCYLYGFDDFDTEGDLDQLLED